MHTALGTLIQHKKEHLLHCDLGGGFVHRNDRLLYYTTTSWMMWHWSVSALAAGCSLVLYSGSPFRPRGLLSMPRLIDELNVTHFGTSAAYLVTLEAKGILLEPSQGTEEPDKPSSPPPNLSRLRAIYSTASPLPPSTFRYVYRAFSSPPDDDGNRSTKSPSLNLASITGGTDIISLFGAPNPLLPVLVGKVQCVGLGMAVAAVDPVTGAPVPRGEEGDLVCTEPFPSMPLTFWVEGGGGVTAQKGQEKYRDAYFARFPGVWHHGDFVRLDGPLPGGAMTMLGRSDGVLKPAGVRFGSAEIYNVLARFFAAEVEDAVCVGRRREGVDKDETVCLFVALRSNEDASGNSKPTLDGPGGLRESIKDVVRRELSPRHVPGIIEECGPLGVPKTSNGKK